MLENLNMEIWNIINVATGIIDWIIFFLAIDSVGNKKESNIKYIFGIITIFTLTAFLNTANIFPNIKIIICMIVGTLFYILLYKDKIHKCILVSLLFWLSLIITDGLGVGIVIMANRLDSVNILLSGNVFRIQCVIISKILLFTLFILFKYFKFSLEFKFKDIVLIGLPIVSNIASLILVFGYNLKSDLVNKENIIILIFITLMIVLSSIVLLIVIGKIVQDDKLKLEYELINERINASNKTYENINEIHDKLKYVYHDFKNHMICIKSYDTKEEIISYIVVEL